MSPSLLLLVQFGKPLMLHAVDLLNGIAQSPSQTASQPVTDLEMLERSITQISEMLDRVLAYVRSVLSGQVKGDPAIGRYLMDTLGTSTDDSVKNGFHASLQVRICCPASLPSLYSDCDPSRIH